MWKIIIKSAVFIAAEVLLRTLIKELSRQEAQNEDHNYC